MMMGVVACGNATPQKHDAEAVAVEQQPRSFRLPEVPSTLKDPAQRAVYVVEHYWDHFDFRDTAYIHLPDITEQAAVDYMDLLRLVPKEVALGVLKGFVAKASVEPLMMDYMWKTFFRYWHELNSPLKNEDMFILFCQGVEQTPAVKLVLREKAGYLRSMAEKNRVGQSAIDFVYTLASGKQGRMSALKAEYTLLFFYDPDCETCTEVKKLMRQSAGLKEMVAAGKVKVLTVYPDEDIALWRNRLGEMDAAWINAYDKGQVLTMEQRYDLSSLPSFYLLDKDKKVLLKDADWREITQFFEK
jgi:thioredoxin-related protein